MLQLIPITSKNLIDSPVRKQIYKDILDGNTAVWILLESGDKEKDDNAANFLETYLKELEGTLKLPDPVEGNNYVDDSESEIYEGKIKFSLHRISRDDPQEQFTIQMFLNTESDLRFIQRTSRFPCFRQRTDIVCSCGKRNLQRKC